MAGLTQWLTLALLVQSGLPGLAGRSVQRPRASQQGQAGESCTTGQDLIVQALEKLNPNSPVSAVQDANRSMQRATDLCAESGTAWYYRSLLESRLQHKPQADYAMRQAMLFPSDALRDQLNPFVLAAPPGKGKPPARIRERWALVVGIGDFADKRIGKLAYTTADATAMRDVLVDPKLGGFRPENVRLLTDAGASLADIKMGINWLARSAAPEDLVVVYVASHGSPRRVDTAGATYILTHDTAIDPSDVRAALDEARSDGFTVVFLDTAPRATSIATAIVEAADFAVVPVRPSAFDLRTLDQSLAIVAAARRPGIVLLNACPARAPEVSEARSICMDRTLPLSTVELGDRRAYARAVQSGRAVMEFEPKGAAADEIARLWRDVDLRSTQHALV